MLNNREAYLCLSAMLRAREARMLTEERARRMLDAPTFEDAAKLLTDCGYEDMSGMNAREIEAALAAHRDGIMEEISRLAPDSVIPDVFKMKYDYHNAKVILKSEAMDLDPDALLVSSGRIPGTKLKLLYNEEKYSEMPGALGNAMEEAKALLARSANPQQTDFLLDREYFGEITACAEESGNDFLKGYAAMLIDAANLKSTVRTLRMGKGPDFLKSVLIRGGSVDCDRLANADKESLSGLYVCSLLEKAAEHGVLALEGESLTPFELACDNACNAYISKAKLVSFGSEPLTAYLAALENEVTAVRMILCGRLSGVRSEVIGERLRDTYA